MTIMLFPGAQNTLRIIYLFSKSLLWLAREVGGEWQRGWTGRERERQDRDGESERGYAWNGVRRLRLRQICLVELQMHFLFTCLCMPQFLIVFLCQFYWAVPSHNGSVRRIMSIYLHGIIHNLSPISTLSSDSCDSSRGALWGEELTHSPFLCGWLWWHISYLDEVTQDVSTLHTLDNLPSLPSPQHVSPIITEMMTVLDLP